jgi:hypothetical protein
MSPSGYGTEPLCVLNLYPLAAGHSGETVMERRGSLVFASPPAQSIGIRTLDSCYELKLRSMALQRIVTWNWDRTDASFWDTALGAWQSHPTCVRLVLMERFLHIVSDAKGEPSSGVAQLAAGDSSPNPNPAKMLRTG